MTMDDRAVVTDPSGLVYDAEQRDSTSLNYTYTTPH